LAANDPNRSFGYGFKLPDTGHWQSVTIDQPVKVEPMPNINKLTAIKTLDPYLNL
ncbi:MAG: hypothetical protein CG438_1169, partial [Methylococcaceae bacterium NSP1-1]